MNSNTGQLHTLLRRLNRYHGAQRLLLAQKLSTLSVATTSTLRPSPCYLLQNRNLFLQPHRCGGHNPHDWPTGPVGSGAERGVHAEDYHDPTELTNVRQPDDYKPGTDHWAYDNPWPKLNKGRLDWLFQEGWRRPLAKDQGGHLRREWIPFGWDGTDEYEDWRQHHSYLFLVITITAVWFSLFMLPVVSQDYPKCREWAIREAFLEIERREKAGLPIISPDIIERKRVEAVLPSDEELGDFDIII